MGSILVNLIMELHMRSSSEKYFEYRLKITFTKNLMDVHMRSIGGNFHQKPNGKTLKFCKLAKRDHGLRPWSRFARKMTILQKKIGVNFFSSNVTASKVSTAQISVHFDNFLCNFVFSGALWFAAKKYFFFYFCT